MNNSFQWDDLIIDFCNPGVIKYMGNSIYVSDSVFITLAGLKDIAQLEISSKDAWPVFFRGCCLNHLDTSMKIDRMRQYIGNFNRAGKKLPIKMAFRNGVVIILQREELNE